MRGSVENCIAPPLRGNALYPDGMTSFDWRTASPEEVDHQYSPSRFALRPLDEYFNEYATKSAPFRDKNLVHTGQPLLIYIHGGYWQALSAGDSLFNAPEALALNVSLHSVEYTLAPHASVQEIVNECLLDVARIIHEARPSRVVLAGSSAGAHLVAMCARDAIIAPLLSGAVMLSGVYDLRPLVVTPTNDALKLDEHSAEHVSPHLLNPSAHLGRALLAVGDHEPSEFIRQTIEYAQHLSQVGTDVATHIMSGHDHFDIPYLLLQAGNEVGDWVLNILMEEQHVA